MIISPIIPIPIMGIICILGLFFCRSNNKFEILRRVLIIVLIFVINLRIMRLTPNVKTQEKNLNIDVFFVIDNTISMVAEDFNGSTPRLEAVKEHCDYIVDQLTGAKFSVITFSNEATVMIPITKDNSIAKEAINSLVVPRKQNATGSSMNLPIDLLEKKLKQQTEKGKEREKIVFFISDGEITEEEGTLESYKKCKRYIDNGAVLGYGTSSGGKMRIEDYSGLKQYVKYYDKDDYYQEKTGISKIDEENLKTIANDLGIDYIKVDKQKDIESKVNEIVKNTKQSLADEDKTLYQDIYFIFVIPLIGLLVYEYIYYRRNL